MDNPNTFEQLQGKRNARSWKRTFKVAARAKGVWDVFGQARLCIFGDFFWVFWMNGRCG
jgi:hypothetical protein